MTKKQRPEIVQGWTRRIQTGCGRLYITVNEIDGKPFEIFCKLGKAGGCAASQVEAIGRLVATALKAGVEIGEIVKQLIGISCHMPAFGPKGRILSCSDGVAQVLAERYSPETVFVDPPQLEVEVEKAKASIVAPKEKQTKPKSFEEMAMDEKKKKGMGACPECGGQVMFQEGCKKCMCGWTEC